MRATFDTQRNQGGFSDQYHICEYLKADIKSNIKDKFAASQARGLKSAQWASETFARNESMLGGVVFQ